MGQAHQQPQFGCIRFISGNGHRFQLWPSSSSTQAAATEPWHTQSPCPCCRWCRRETPPIWPPQERRERKHGQIISPPGDPLPLGALPAKLLPGVSGPRSERNLGPDWDTPHDDTTTSFCTNACRVLLGILHISRVACPASSEDRPKMMGGQILRV